jgi:hypothetical protein
MNTWQLIITLWLTHALAFAFGGYWVYSRMSKDDSVLTSEYIEEGKK